MLHDKAKMRYQEREFGIEKNDGRKILRELGGSR